MSEQTRQTPAGCTNAIIRKDTTDSALLIEDGQGEVEGSPPSQNPSLIHIRAHELRLSVDSESCPIPKVAIQTYSRRPVVSPECFEVHIFNPPSQLSCQYFRVPMSVLNRKGTDFFSSKSESSLQFLAGPTFLFQCPANGQLKNQRASAHDCARPAKVGFDRGPSVEPTKLQGKVTPMTVFSITLPQVVNGVWGMAEYLPNAIPILRV
jgi:hypothetical protein